MTQRFVAQLPPSPGRRCGDAGLAAIVALFCALGVMRSLPKSNWVLRATPRPRGVYPLTFRETALMNSGISDEVYQNQILPHVSRTFALTIPQLPEPLRVAVT